MQVYFCDPQRPWQRGINENTNGLLRQYFPKGTDLTVHSAEEIAAVAAALNIPVDRRRQLVQASPSAPGSGGTLDTRRCDADCRGASSGDKPCDLDLLAERSTKDIRRHAPQAAVDP